MEREVRALTRNLDSCLAEWEACTEAANNTILRQRLSAELKSRTERLKVLHTQILDATQADADYDRLYDDYSQYYRKIETLILDINESEKQAANASMPNNIIDNSIQGTTSNPDATNQNVAVRNDSGSNLAGNSVRLPKFEIPKFSGRYEDWTSFSDIFESRIMQNGSLNDIDKLTYLKSSVTGEAARVIASYKITSENLLMAWEALSFRYKDIRSIVRSHFNKMFYFPKLKAGDSIGLRQLQSSMKENKQALENQGLNFDKCESMLIFLIADKMDFDTRKEWEIQSAGNDLQTFAQVDKFIHTKSKALEQSGPQQNHVEGSV